MLQVLEHGQLIHSLINGLSIHCQASAPAWKGYHACDIVNALIGVAEPNHQTRICARIEAKLWNRDFKFINPRFRHPETLFVDIPQFVNGDPVTG